MREAKGFTAGVAAGPGIFLTGDPAKESIFLSKRKGFVRMAIQAGAGAAQLAHQEGPCPAGRQAGFQR